MIPSAKGYFGQLIEFANGIHNYGPNRRNCPIIGKMPSPGQIIGLPELHQDMEPATSEFLEEFYQFLRKEARTIFYRSAALSHVTCPFGNVGALIPVHLWLSLCGLPLPAGFREWESKCGAFAPILNNNPRFYLDAQAAFFGTLTHTLYSSYVTAWLYIRQRPEEAKKLVAKAPAGDSRGIRNLTVETTATSPMPIVYWQGRALTRASTIDEWFLGASPIKRTLNPGNSVTLVEFSDGLLDPFYAGSVTTIENGLHAGDLMLRQCVRPARAPVLSHFGITTDHPLGEWLGGYDALPDQRIASKKVILTAGQVAGEWAALPAHNNWRNHFLDGLRQNLPSL